MSVARAVGDIPAAVRTNSSSFNTARSRDSAWLTAEALSPIACPAREDQRRAVVAAYPRGADFRNGIIDAFYDGMKHRPHSTFGTFNDDILAFKDPDFRRVDLCSVILHSRWDQA
jgi:hypothetical protein